MRQNYRQKLKVTRIGILLTNCERKLFLVYDLVDYRKYSIHIWIILKQWNWSILIVERRYKVRHFTREVIMLVQNDVLRGVICPYDKASHLVCIVIWTRVDLPKHLPKVVVLLPTMLSSNKWLTHSYICRFYFWHLNEELLKSPSRKCLFESFFSTI